MSTAKEEAHALLTKLPDDCSLEDIRYHLYVIEKVRNGLEVADSQGAIPQEQVEQRFGKWLTEYHGDRARLRILKRSHNTSPPTAATVV